MGQNVILMRHGKASVGLTNYGVKQAESMATRLIANDLIPDVILTSPLPRAVETAMSLTRIFHDHDDTHEVQIIEVKELTCDAPADPAISVLKKIDDKYQTALIVTHQPNIEDLSSAFGRHACIDNAVCVVFKRDQQAKEVKYNYSGLTLNPDV
jgi:phosphohistidine phosphatase SixA